MTSQTTSTQTMQDPDTTVEYTIELGTLDRSDGSAHFTHRPSFTTVLASANGPIAVSQRDEKLGEAHLEVRLQPLRGAGSVKERDTERIVTDTLRSILLLHLHPRTLLQVTAQVVTDASSQIDSRGSYTASVRESGQQQQQGRRIRYQVMAAAINACAVALADSGFPMRGLVTAAAWRTGTVDDRGSDTMEEDDQAEVITDYLVAYSYPDRKLVTLESSGRIDETSLLKTLAHGAELCDAVHEVVRASLQHKVESIDGWQD